MLNHLLLRRIHEGADDLVHLVVLHAAHHEGVVAALAEFHLDVHQGWRLARAGAHLTNEKQKQKTKKFRMRGVTVHPSACGIKCSR